MRTIAPTILLGLLLTACAGPHRLQPALGEAEVLQRLGPPTGRYPMADGATRLEFASGPFGRETWMVDLDATGRVREWHNALEEYRLHALQQRAGRQPALRRDELLRTLGRPGEVSSGGWLGAGQLWSWRYPTNDCLWFQATLDADGTVRDAGFNIDLRCDAQRDSRV